MSHVIKQECEILDIESLKKAVAMFPDLEWREKKTYHWYGRHVGDYPLPEGISISDLGKCEFAIGVKGNPKAYEVGVAKKKNGEGYELLVDFYAGGFGLCEKVGEKVPTSRKHEDKQGYNCMKIVNAYMAQVQSKAMKKEGYSSKVVFDANGKCQVRLTQKGY